MRFYFIFSLVIIYTIIISGAFASADCINSRLAKSSYLPYETVQVEVDSQVTRDITTGDLFLSRGGLTLPARFFISKISSSKYFIWFDLPKEDGNYSLKIRANCMNGLQIFPVSFKVDKTLASKYDEIKSSVSNWQLSLDDHIAAAGVLIDDSIASQALIKYSERKDSCINKNCSTKLNALTLMAFNDNLVRQKMQNAIMAAQKQDGCFGNGSGVCDENSTVYALLSLTRTNRLINDSKTINATDWLLKNNPSIKAKAIIYLINRDPVLLDSILNTQSSSGWWPKTTEYKANIETTAIVVYVLKNSIANGTSSDVLNAISKGEKWLLNQNESSALYDKAFILFMAFSSHDIEPQLTIWPGMIKTGSLGSFDLILQNKGVNDITLSTNLLNSTTLVSLPQNTIKTLKFNVPLITTIDGRVISENLVLTYYPVNSEKIYGYDVPIIIFSQKSNQEQIIGPINASQEIINQTRQQEIINESENEEENETIEINQSLLSKFKFLGSNFIKNMKTGETSTFTLRLSNGMDKDIEDVRLTWSSSLIGVVDSVDPNSFSSIAKDDYESITVYLNPTIARIYDGEIIANAKYDGQYIETDIPIRINVTTGTGQGPSIQKNCSNLGGNICKEGETCDVNLTNAYDTYYCCTGKCKGKSSTGTIIAVVAIILAVIILLVVLRLLKRKPKKEMQEYLEEATKQYEKKFQRPSGMSRV